MILALFACAPVEPAPCDPSVDGLPAFPGAVGFGADTPGGRGGTTYLVTTTADDGPGSLRAAMEAEGPRTVVFDVAGAITLTRQIEVHAPFLTVAGQTAPGGGVVVTGAGVVIMTHDVVLRYLRIRPGLGPVPPDLNDGLTLLTPDEGDAEPVHDVIVDHVSVSWGEDELLAMHAVRDVTLSWSLLAEGLNDARHEKGPHSTGVLVGFSSTCVSVHHNLLAHNGFRNPLLSNIGRVDVASNLVHDFGELAGEWEPGLLQGSVNLVGNVWQAGPASREGASAFNLYLDHPVHASVESYHLVTSGSAWSLHAEANTASAGMGDVLTTNFSDPLPPEALSPDPLPGPDYGPADPSGLFATLEATVGASAPARDAVDTRVVASVASGEGGLVDDPADVGGLDVPTGSPRVDTDRDGLPDDVELEVGADPADPADAAVDPDGDGYTRLDDWFAALAGDP